MAETETPKGKKVTETWTCEGRRYQQGKLWYRWLDKDGAPGHYGKLKGTAGHIYTVDVLHAEDGDSVFPSSLKWKGVLPTDDPARLEMEAHDREAHYQDEQRKLEASAKRTTAIAEVALPIRILLANVPGGHNAERAVRTAIMNELHRPLTKAERDEAGL